MGVRRASWNRDRSLRRVGRAALSGALALAGALASVAPASADPGAPTIAGLPGPGVVGSPYAFAYDVTGSPTCSVVAPDTLPPGLALDPVGCSLSGTPTLAGTFTFTVTATIGIPPDASVDSMVEIAAAAPTISGTPPPGLTLSPDGTLSGRPSRAGSYPFTVQADVIAIQPKPHITIQDAQVREGNAGLTAMTFVVSLSRPGLYPVPVHWTTVNGTARAGSDYRAASGQRTLLPGQLTQTITVQVRGDRVKERDKVFSVQLSNTTHADFADRIALGTIRNDD